MKKEKLFISKTPSFAYPKAPYPDCVVSGLYILRVCVCVKDLNTIRLLYTRTRLYSGGSSV